MYDDEEHISDIYIFGVRGRKGASTCNECRVSTAWLTGATNIVIDAQRRIVSYSDQKKSPESGPSHTHLVRTWLQIGEPKPF